MSGTGAEEWQPGLLTTICSLPGSFLFALYNLSFNYICAPASSACRHELFFLVILSLCRPPVRVPCQLWQLLMKDEGSQGFASRLLLKKSALNGVYKTIFMHFEKPWICYLYLSRRVTKITGYLLTKQIRVSSFLRYLVACFSLGGKSADAWFGARAKSMSDGFKRWKTLQWDRQQTILWRFEYECTSLLSGSPLLMSN